jgi:hypothetical protein
MTKRQCKLRDCIAKRLKGREGVRNEYALATSIVNKKREAKSASQSE